MIGSASVTLVANDAWSASTLSSRIALRTLGAQVMTVAIDTSVLILSSIESFLAFFTMNTTRVALAFDTVASMARSLVQLEIKVALLRETVT